MQVSRLCQAVLTQVVEPEFFERDWHGYLLRACKRTGIIRCSRLRSSTIHMIARHAFLNAPAGMHRIFMTMPLFHDGFAMRVAMPLFSRRRLFEILKSIGVNHRCGIRAQAG